MFSSLRIWTTSLALIVCGGAEPAKRDLESLVAAERSLAAVDRETGTPEARWAWVESLARVAWSMVEAERHQEAADRYRTAITALPEGAETQEPEFVAMLHDGLGRACQNNGDFDQAEAHLKAGLRLRSAQAGAETRQGISEGHLGLLELVLGRYSEAERLFRSALEHTPEDRGDLLAHRHDCLGRYFLTLRAHDLAAAHYEKAIAYAAAAAESGDPLLVDLRGNLALCRFRAGDAAGALLETDSLLGVEAEGSLRRSGLLNLSATIHASLGDFEMAGKQAEEALAIVSEAKGGDHPAVAPLLANLGAVRLQAGDPGGALEPLQRARALLQAKVSDHHQALVEVLYQIAACRLNAGPAAEARQAVIDARAAAAGLMSELVAKGSERELLTFLQQVDLHSILCQLGDAALIADSLLAGKGRIMEAMLDRRTRSLGSAQRIEKLQSEVDRLLFDGTAGDEVRSNELRIEMRKLSEGVGEAVDSPRHWQDLAKALPAGTACVDCVRYTAADGKVRYGAVVVMNIGSPVWIPLGEESLMGRLDLLHRSLETRANVLRNGGGSAGIPMVPLLADLYRAFWQPVAAALPDGIREVIVCPEGRMHLLPFAVLRSPEGRFLCEEIASLRVVDSGRRLMGKSLGLVDFGKPWLVLGVADFAPHRKILREGGKGWAPAWSAALEGIGDLPTVKKEIEALRKLAPEGSTILLDGTAAESALRGRSDSPALLHFASHGFHVPLAGSDDLTADPSALYENGILLGIGGLDDGILFPEEIGALDLRGTGLVTLSTCRGALGRPVSGEGVLGLRRGFAKAGARNVMASLWEIPDRSTAEFMADYYAALKSGKNPAALLWTMQAGRLAALRDEAPTGDALETAILSYGGFVISAAE